MDLIQFRISLEVKIKENVIIKETKYTWASEIMEAFQLAEHYVKQKYPNAQEVVTLIECVEC